PMRLRTGSLGQKLRGHYGYFGIGGNPRAISRFFHETRKLWRKWLNRRSQRNRTAIGVSGSFRPRSLVYASKMVAVSG
ncbi:MAG: hypothetical protein ACRETB_06970, partial [Steroidobacteraceae bacterium]